MARELRPWQTEACAAVRAEWAAGNARTVVVAATGLGKSSVIAKMAVDEAHAGGRALLVAHREDLLRQMRDTCALFDSTIPVGWVQAGRHSAHHPITVAMAPTLRRAERRGRMPRPTLVIVDECHRAANDTYLGILRWAGAFDDEQPTRVLGVTATLTRGDKRGLGDVFQSVALERGIAWGIEQGFLVRPHGKVVVGEHLDLAGAKISRGDYQDVELGEMVSQDVEHIAAAWTEHARLPDGEHRPTVAFVPTVQAAGDLVAAFAAAGVKAEAVTGKTPAPERRAMYARLRDGVTRVLVNVFVLVEGWDEPSVSCVLMARPTKLQGVYTQAVGRGLRLSPGTGKTDCLVLDVVGASRTTKLATLAELLPGAEVDDVELDVQPCAVCAGYTCRRPAAVKLAEERGMAPCSCRCEDCGELAGACVCGLGGPRDPDGGRRKLVGRAKYAEVDLLGPPESGADAMNWLPTEGGTLFLSAGGRLARLMEGEGGAWSAVHVAAYGRLDEQSICEGLSLASTRVQVERWAREQGAYPRSASWRGKTQSPTDAQLRTARSMGIPDPEGYTRGALSDLIDIRRASRRFDRRAPVEVPSWMQPKPRAAAPAPVRVAADDPRAAVLARARAWGRSG